jgi:hypothetical protein
MMKNSIIASVAALSFLAAGNAAGLDIDGFLQGLYGGRLDSSNPTSTEQTASETRLQLRFSHYGEGGEFFGRLDFAFDGADTLQYDWELREAFAKFRLGEDLDVKVGRQVLTWGTGDLLFINDVFAKDYRSFFIGRDDQYLKAPQNGFRLDYYNPWGDLSFVWTPRFEPNRLPTGSRLSYYDPLKGAIVGGGVGVAPLMPEPSLGNAEFAGRYSRGIGGFEGSLYAYRGFYKNPLGALVVGGSPVPVYPRLHVFGASLRGQVGGGILWAEGGYFDSREDRDGDDPFLPNSSVTGMAGFERQVATNFTVNGQWQADVMMHHDTYRSQQEAAGAHVRDRVKHLLTTRITKLLRSELLMLSGFLFYSPTDRDLYLRLSTEYKYTDEVILTLGANVFHGEEEATDFGQFMKNDNVYLKVTYGF